MPISRAHKLFRGFSRFEYLLAAAMFALSAAVARYGTIKFEYGALGFAGLLVASMVAFGLLALAACILLGVVDVWVHKRRMREQAGISGGPAQR